MQRTQKISLWLTGLFVIALLYLQYTAPKPIDWSKSLSRWDKIPYGGYILYDRLPDIFPEQSIKSVEEPAYNVLSSLLKDSVGDFHKNYLLINNSAELDSLDVNYLLQFVQKGGSAWIAAEYISSSLADTLGLEIDYLDALWAPQSKSDSAIVCMTHPQYTNQTWQLPRNYVQHGIAKYDTTHTQVYGVVVSEMGEENPIFIGVSLGKGAFYIFSNPLLLSNYCMLNLEGASYAAAALSHLPVGSVLWDEYYKPNSLSAQLRSETPFRFLLSQPPLRYMLYLAIVGIGLFMVFEAKRRQRAIPVVVPPQNTTADFVQTIGGLYYKQGNHTDIAQKKATYFADFVRHQLHLKTPENTPEYAALLSQKTGVPTETLLPLLTQWEIAQKGDTSITESFLQTFHRQLTNFYVDVAGSF